MAKTTLRIRFVFSGQGTDETSRRSRQTFGKDFASTVVEDFAFRYADTTYKEIAKSITTEFERDARKELVHMVSLFRQHIIGANAGSTGPAGKLNSVVDTESKPIAIRASLPPWAKRSREYLRNKRAKVKHDRWFEHGGQLRSLSKADVWVSMFGPIRATFVKSPSRSRAAGRSTRIFRNRSTGMQLSIAVGTIKVFALTNITPQMLPALATGDPTTMNKTLNPGLVGLLGDRTPLAYRLGGTQTAKEGGHIYRPTLEPFLAFYLTRAIPAAVRNRLNERGITSGRSSAGRTRR